MLLIGSSLLKRKTDWIESKKETKLIALRNKNRKKRRGNFSRELKSGSIFL